MHGEESPGCAALLLLKSRACSNLEDTVQIVLEALFDQEADEVDDAAGIAPLVVVPADDLAVGADGLGQLCVKDGGARVALEVAELTSSSSS